MKIVPRILLFGVGLPVACLVGSVAIAGRIFRSSLVEDVDRRLLAQAAVESVSLFDGPDGRPHVHLPRSPLASEVATFAPETVLLDPAGHVVFATSDEAAASPFERVAEVGRPRLASPDEHSRSLTLGVMRPGDGLYTLHLVASLEAVETTMASFHRALGLTVAAIALALSAVLYAQARGLARRVGRMIGFGSVIGRGATPDGPTVSGGDELAELHRVLADAARHLHERGLAQERFLANAAHQLRTPLAVLRTEVDLALRRPRDAEHLREALAMARAEIERLTLLARKLLDFESLRSQVLALQDVDVSALVREVVDRHRGPAVSRGRILAVGGEPSAVLTCDPLLVAQAVENLLENALRFGPEGSCVSVTSAVFDGAWRCTVADTGPGIADEDREKVFEPFQRGSAPESQTGLGLAFVADVARKHAGRAYLGRPERGTEVVLEIPLGAAQSSQPAG